MPFQHRCCTVGALIPSGSFMCTAVEIVKILIVDVEIDLTDTLARFLAQFGHDRVTAPDLRRAVDSMAKHRPALVLAELRLRDGDGFDVIKRARQTLPETRVIIMTAYHAPRLERASLRVGAAAYLPKPFTLADLRKAVESA